MSDIKYEYHPPIISREAMDELRLLSIPIARWLVLHGLIHDEVRITSLGADVFSPKSGARFISEDEDKIFQE